MSVPLPFFGREKEVNRLRTLHRLSHHVLIVGPPGIGKSALVHQVQQFCPILICRDSSSLGRICECLEPQLGWSPNELTVIERKNRLLIHLQRRRQPVAFDRMAHTQPRVARFIGQLSEKIPVWIICRSDRARDIGHVWQNLYNFTRIEISRLNAAETRLIIEGAAGAGRIQEDAIGHADELHRICGGNPRILEQLLIELTSRKYRIDRSFGFDLLDLDRRIHEINLATKPTANRQRS